jgi:hypothetical protein
MESPITTPSRTHCAYPGCPDPPGEDGIACDVHAAAEEERRAKIAAKKRGKPRSAEVRAKLSAAKTGVPQIERGEHEGHPERANRPQRPELTGWRDSGDAPGRWVEEPGRSPTFSCSSGGRRSSDSSMSASGLVAGGRRSSAASVASTPGRRRHQALDRRARQGARDDAVVGDQAPTRCKTRPPRAASTDEQAPVRRAPR